MDIGAEPGLELRGTDARTAQSRCNRHLGAVELTKRGNVELADPAPALDQLQALARVRGVKHLRGLKLGDRYVLRIKPRRTAGFTGYNHRLGGCNLRDHRFKKAARRQCPAQRLDTGIGCATQWLR